MTVIKRRDAVVLRVEDTLKYDSLQTLKTYFTFWQGLDKDKVDIFLVSERPKILRCFVESKIVRFVGEYTSLLMGVDRQEVYDLIKEHYVLVFVGCTDGEDSSIYNEYYDAFGFVLPSKLQIGCR